MEDDLISSLTRQVREDVIENYLQERNLVCLQIESLQWLAGKVRASAQNAGRCLQRLAYLTIHPEMTERLARTLGIPPGSYWSGCLECSLPDDLRLICTRGITQKSRFRKLVLEAHRRLVAGMEKYRLAHAELEAELQGVNLNIKTFQKNFDVLGILSFLRNLDTLTVEKKQIMGENFTAEEIASLDQRLFIRPMRFDELNVPPPVPLPGPGLCERRLTELADEIYRKHPAEVRMILR